MEGFCLKYGDILKKLRKNKGLSQKELTDRLNINRSTYARYETSQTQPDYDTLKIIADFFEVTTDYILGRSDNPNQTEEESFESFINDPELRRWHRELPKSKEEDIARLKRIWEAYKND